jgi:hypothetical protein
MPCSPAEPCTVSRIDPGSNRLVGTPTRLPADGWDLAVGAGSVWATQFDGRLIRIDARTGRIRARISARPIYFGSVVTTGGGFVWTGKRIVELSPGPIFPVVGADWIWSSSAEAWSGTTKDDRVLRIDPRTLRIVQVLHLAGNVPSVGFGFGSVWVPVGTASAVVRIAPAARNRSTD